MVKPASDELRDVRENGVFYQSNLNPDHLLFPCLFVTGSGLFTEEGIFSPADYKRKQAIGKLIFLRRLLPP
ncbi:MAG: hypothetical protein QOH25_2621 [Acidobacteriota bacterium]|jgi:hypothetical protein|nr:hypothetical protein [Acidobacteriota bacterium]